MMHVRILCACAFLYHLSTAHYTQQWAVHISGGKTIANEVARDYGFVNLGEIFPDYYHFTHKGVSKRSARPHLGHQARLSVDERVHWAQQQKARSRQKRDMKLIDLDPRWPNMWYLNRGNGLDMNVIPAWLEGITGKGAVVTILDDGLEKDHPDLIQNYDPLASYDVNSHDSDPSPRYDMIDSNRHGTRCAGEVAATSNNSVCALGIAHGAQVGGVRMLDGDVTDAVEARSLSLNPQHIDIYSASWGPDDDGKTVDGPGELATRAFIEGVTKGRGGKGSIFVWASGNGGRDHDNCNCDGYTNSIYSLSISSATEQGHVPWYSEACSSTLASTYSSGALGERQVITTDLHHSCTNSHTGTSASAPLAAGICALALQANPSLTWRDMQHIVVRTARPENLIAPDWQTNGVGRNVSHSFGYGLMDAYAMVKLARKWVTVPEQHRCEITAPHVDKLVPAKSVVVLKLAVTACEGVQILEHVQAKLSIYTQRRGDLHIQLTSPMGTKVTLLAHRSHDTSRLGFNHWPFMSVHSWGEPPFGTWQLEIHNDGRLLARLQKWELVLHGTETLPEVDMMTGVNVVPVAPVSASSAGASTSVDVQLNAIDVSEESWKPNPQTRIDEMHRLHIQQMSAENASSGCVKSDSSTCLECSPGSVLYDGVCSDSCPDKHYQGTTQEMANLCLPCHYTCKHCQGGADYQCLDCYEDAQLYIVSDFEMYCYPTSVLNRIHISDWYYRIYVLLVAILLAIMVTLIAYFTRSYFFKSRWDNDIIHSATLKNIRQIESDIKTTIYSDSE